MVAVLVARNSHIQATKQKWVGYERFEVDTEVLADALENGTRYIKLKQNPFYAEAGGQVRDTGYVEGDGWRMEVEGVFRHEDEVVISGTVEGKFEPSAVRAFVDESRRDTQRNHTATHLLHAALRRVLGEHVTQAGSLVAPDRLRFDFTHSGPLFESELDEIELLVNEEIWADKEVTKQQTKYRQAIDRGAMALFGEKYGEVVRVVEVPDFSLELCGGCHVRTTGEIGLFKIVSETGSAAGVRRIEAVTASKAYNRVKQQEQLLLELSRRLKVPTAELDRRVVELLAERRESREQFRVNVQQSAATQVAELVENAEDLDGTRIATGNVETRDTDELRALGDSLRERLGSGVAVIAAKIGDRHSLLAVVTDDLIGKGVRADAVVREVAKLAGGKGGGRPHMAQASMSEPARAQAALEKVTDIVRPMLEKASA